MSKLFTNTEPMESKKQNNNSINILFLIAEFAPVNTTGNFRSLKFVKYLPDLGINPVVITLPAEEGASLFNAKLDNRLLDEIPPSVEIYRISPEVEFNKKENKLKSYIKHFLRFGSDGLGKYWIKKLSPALKDIIRKHDIEAIYTTLPPFSMGMVARSISKKYKLPLFVDMRDLWSHWGSGPFLTYAHYAMAKHKEKKIFQQASLVFCVTPQLIKTFQKTHPSIDGRKFKLLTNGFDNDLNLIQPIVLNKDSKFVIGYTGAFYYHPEVNKKPQGIGRLLKFHKLLHYYPTREDWLYRSPYFFLKALAHLFAQEPSFRDRVEIAFIGHIPAWLPGMIEEFGLKDNYHAYGFRPASETKEMQKSFDAFLATSEKVENDEHYCLPSKLFDYVNQSKPIVGFVTEGIQKEFLLKSGMGIICDPDNTEGSAKVLKELINGNIALPHRNTAYLEKFQRKNIAAQLAEYLKKELITPDK